MAAEARRGEWPKVHLGALVRSLLPLFAGALALWGATARESTAAAGPVDPAALLLRVVGFALVAQGAVGLVRVVREMRRNAAGPRASLLVDDEAVELDVGRARSTVRRGDVASVRTSKHWSERGAADDAGEVVIVTRGGSMPQGHVIVPPFFGPAGTLAEELMRWVGPAPETPPSFPPQSELPSKVYDEAARGRAPSDVLAIRHGRRFLLSGPYATVFLALAVLDGWVRLGPLDRAAVGLEGLAIASVIAVLVPLGWLALALRHVAPRKGLALVLTPAELMLRTRRGVLAIPWPDLIRVSVAERPTFSVLLGLHTARALVLERRDAPSVRYDEEYLGLPAFVVAAIADAHRRGLMLPRA